MVLRLQGVGSVAVAEAPGHRLSSRGSQAPGHRLSNVAQAPGHRLSSRSPWA